MHTDYRISAMHELRDQQVRFAPRKKIMEQVAAAEKLLTEIEPDRIYTYEYLCYRITHFRPEACRDVKFAGREAKHDLGLFVEDLSDAANIAAESAGERVVTIEELAKRFNVSTKTISRWRRLGLISRRFVMDGRKRVGFLESSVDRFVAQNSDKVRRGSQFSQLSESERATILQRARRLAQAGGAPAEIVRRIARKVGRSPETVRYTLKQFDQENADLAIFPDYHGPIRPETKRQDLLPIPSRRVGRGRWQGVFPARGPASTASLPRCGPSRLPNCLWITSPTTIFPRHCGRRKREKRILEPMPDNDEPMKKARLPAGLPPYLASLYEVPLLSRTQEAHLFRKMNFLKYKAVQVAGEAGCAASPNRR